MTYIIFYSRYNTRSGEEEKNWAASYGDTVDDAVSMLRSELFPQEIAIIAVVKAESY